MSQILTDESSTEAEVAAEGQPVGRTREERESNCSNETEDEFMAENVQTFKNMAYLQNQYRSVSISESEKIHIEVEPGKRLLLLDMDETLLHAATVNDIFEQQIYGPNAKPSFYTSFRDQENLIEIGVFLRPCLQELIQRVSPHFTMAVFTASERLYADTILDQIDPHQVIFKKRIYRTKCLKTVLPPSEQDQSSQRQSTGSSVEQKPIYIKDLRIISGIDISQIVIVDNQFQSFALHPDNGIPISSYFYDPLDTELRCLADYLLEKLVYGFEDDSRVVQSPIAVTDVRVVNRQQFKLQKIIDLASNRVESIEDDDRLADNPRSTSCSNLSDVQVPIEMQY